MTNRSAAHTALRNDILVALTEAYHPRGLFWPVNVGLAVTRRGAVVRYGLNGQADIACCVDGHHIEIEVKTGKAVQNEDQENWQTAIAKAGGIYIVARSVEDALNGVRRAVGVVK